MSSISTHSVREYLHDSHERLLGELVEFARLRSVSADPAYQEEVNRAARWVADRLTVAGLSDVQIIPTARTRSCMRSGSARREPRQY